MIQRLSVVFVVLATAGSVVAEEGATTRPAWVGIGDAVVKSPATGKDVAVGSGGISGVAVDRTNGDVYAVLRNGNGILKSEDQGTTFKDGTAVGGRTVMYSGSICVDPAGKRVAVFTIYGAGGMTVDGGKTWKAFRSDADMGKYFDFGVVAWEGKQAGKAMLGGIHESKGRLVLSMDGGATWKELGTGYAEKGSIGIVDEKILLATRGKFLSRSVDGGETWSKVLEIPAGPRSPVITVFKGACYLLTEKGLMVSKDQGATWVGQGEAVKANIGPLIGRDENHLAVVGAEGCYETVDGGKHWELVAGAAPGAGPRDFSYAWDPVRGIFYFAQAGKGAMKCVVGVRAQAK